MAMCRYIMYKLSLISIFIVKHYKAKKGVNNNLSKEKLPKDQIAEQIQCNLHTVYSIHRITFNVVQFKF